MNIELGPAEISIIKNDNKLNNYIYQTLFTTNKK